MRGQPRRLAYADPPYPGKAWLYKDHPDYAGEVDHAALVASLTADFDAWALSTSAAALRDVLAVCPEGVRVAAWHRGERPNAGAEFPLNAWEPVIYFGAIAIRRASTRDASLELQTLRDPGAEWLDASTPGQADGSRVVEDLGDASCDAGATRRVDSLVLHARPRRTDPGRVVGAKPAAFCGWIFQLLGAQLGDEFVDVFPGSGGVARAWDVFTGAGTA